MINDKPGVLRDAIVSGVIATVVGVAIVFVLSLFTPFPWDPSQTLVSLGIACFFGSAIGFGVGHRVGKTSPPRH
jgi:hypothetical protein